jgi:predicted DNA-binding ribbon-helix-helix protein
LAGDPSETAIVKRSVTIDGHRTSVSIEEPFWRAIRDIAAAEGRPLAQLLTDIDHNRPSAANLSSSIRLHVLDWYRRRAR